MCGIFGVLDQDGNILTNSDRSSLLDNFYRLSESRGKEAAGIAFIDDSSIKYLKHNIRGNEFRKLPLVKSALEQRDDLSESHPFVLMGHTRMVTNGDASSVENNQPVVRDGLACIHNGIITNDSKIWSEEKDLSRFFQVDTEVFLALVSREIENDNSLVVSAVKALKQLEGGNSFALMHTNSEGIFLATTNGSLFLVTDTTKKCALFASEKYILSKICDSYRLKKHFNSQSIRQIIPGTGVWLSFHGELEYPFDLSSTTLSNNTLSEGKNRNIVDLGSSSHVKKKYLNIPNHSIHNEIEKVTAIDFTPILQLKRCSRCVLPETFPFISFDDDGICNICNSRKATKHPGKNQLLDVLTDASGNRMKCLAPVSGGRDSCYGLHYMVHELDLKPVAYTYDWGMVTDLARRNISRMCGKLGIEHILISADIEKKRKYVRKNVKAWLKRPHLGTVPLFMAGDKQFFYYAEMLRSQMNLDKILFSMNPLERTDFKVGFCGINEGYEKEVHYNPLILNKLRIALFYGKEYLLNPSYLNSSLLDTIGAYLSYYVLPKRYEQLFDFIPWIESEVESTLIDEYDWETSPDTNSTWRIGDGTAAFYNYIYLRVAGFTENDTFRSNQIREGLLDRQTAMSRIMEENQPRIESLAWYFDAIDMNAIEALSTVNSMKRVYGQSP